MQARDGLVLPDRGIPCRLADVHLQRGDVDAGTVGHGERDEQRREDQRRCQQQPAHTPARSPATDHRLHQECVHRQHDERHAPHPRDRRQVQDGPVVDLRDAERPPAEPAQRPGRTHPVRHGPQGGQSDRGQQRTTVTLDRRGEQTEHERGAGAQQGDRHPCHLTEPSDPIERRAVAPDPEDETHERSPCAARGTEQPQEGRDPHECERPPSEWWRRGGHEQPARERDRQ